LEEPSKKKLKKLRWADNEPETAAREHKQVATHRQLNTQIDQSLVTTMAFEDSNTQATQPYTDPRRLGRHGSGLSEDDAVNVICILHPSSPAAHDAVAATAEQNPHHIIPNADLTTEDEESLLDPAALLEHSNREIALRISSQVKNPEMGFTFGRNPDRCDVLLTKDRSDITVSNRHFRIYFTKDGVLMLQDNSTNGTLVDENHLRWKQDKETDDSSRMLQNGTIICILGNGRREIKFLVRLPNRGDYQNAYNTNLERYVSGLPGAKSRLVLSAAEHAFGMHWNGGSVYNVVGCLGKGAFATVYKLATKRDGQVFAAKELDKRRFIKNGILDMKFDNEIQIMKDLRHPNIVQYEDYHDHDDWAYIIMENVPGGELSTYLHKQGPVPEPMVQTITRQILHALAYLHARGITHRDIKPDNILISERDPLRVKLSDFGLSKCITDHETFLKTFCGTLLYCAPEIYPGYTDYDKGETKKRRRLGDPSPKRYSERVDMWSFGAVLFHLLCNKPPVISDGENKAALMLTKIMTKDIDFGPLYALDISEEAVDFISGLLKRNPVLRPTPRACFQHAWLAEVADLVDYMNLDDEMPAYRGQGLSTVEEADEDLLAQSDDAEFDQIFGLGGGLTFGYLNTAGERIAKRQRTTAKAGAKAAAPQSVEVAYPQLPQVPQSMDPPATNTRDERLFGEITSSALRSSGVFAAAPPPVSVPALQHRVEKITVNDFVTFDNEAPPSSSEAAGPPLEYPRTLDIPGAAHSSAPSLLGAEAQIGQLNMASPEAGHSEVTTPDTGNPTTPETRELTPATRPPSDSDKVPSCREPADDALEQPIFSRYIDLQVPESLAHDTEFVNAFNARQAEAKSRRARKAAERERQAQKVKTFSGAERTKDGTEELAQTVGARPDKQIHSGSSSTQKGDQRISRKIDLPPLESLHPISTTTADGFTKPLRRFGKLTTVSGSYADVTIYINSRMTSWGRGPGCNVRYKDTNDTRIPLYAVQITYHAPGMEVRMEKGQPWETAPGLHTVVSTGGSDCIFVNDVELRKESSEERCLYYGKIYTGDIITVYQSSEPQGPFLKFRVEMNYGDSARRRPENEKGFQVLRETFHYEREMKRRESMNSTSKEASASGSPPKAM
jgi:serine/threonine protein kinase